MTTENLDDLAAAAAAIEAEAAPPAVQPEAEAAPAADVAGEVAALLKTAAAMLTPAFPCLAEIYTDATCRQLGEAAAPVMAKYGVSVGGLFDRWGAEITLGAVALPVALATYQGVKADLASRNKRPGEAGTPARAGAAAPQPSGAPVADLVLAPPGAE